MAEKGKLEILTVTPYAWVGPDRELIQSSFVVYRDEEGRIGTVVIRKPKPTVEDVKKRRAELARS